MMACARNNQESAATGAVVAASVVTDRSRCCAAAEITAQELYGRREAEILMLPCPGEDGRTTEFDAERRCHFWPRFAHPRWLSCIELHNRNPRRGDDDRRHPPSCRTSCRCGR